jgi:alpha-beta hydrolase superfamily lysophospholipase
LVKRIIDFMVVEQEVVFRSGKWELGGALTFPEDPGSIPAVLLIPGSGQVDRNENARKLHINVFYQISHFLAENGIGSLRYDKRGVGTSQGNFWETGFFDNVNDAQTALEYLKSHERVRPDKVFLLGHSEGAIITTRLAGNGVDIAGAILLAGTAKCGEDVLMWQAQQVVKNMSGIQRWLIDHLHLDVIKSLRKRLDKIKHSNKDWLRVQLIAKVNAKWMREFLAYNPAEDLKKIRVPLLAITGSKDIQVDPADLEKMATLVETDFEYHQIENVSHVLRRIDRNNAGLSSYKQQVLKPMDSEILQLILKWLKEKTK